MKTMRSTKEGSTCADCGTKIEVGDPIAYFGPGRIYGLTCHQNEKTQKHLTALLEEERKNRPFANTERPPKEKETSRIQVPKAPASEWVLRIHRDRLKIDDDRDIMVDEWVTVLSQFNYVAGYLGHAFVDISAPRNVSTAMTKQWAEVKANVLNLNREVKIAEAAPKFE